MALDQQDLDKIKKILEPISSGIAEMKKDISEMKKDISEMKKDIRLLASLNQLDEIRKEPRLRKLYNNTEELEA